MELIKHLFFMVNIGVILYLIFLGKKETESTWAWILLLFHFPMIGFFLFLLIGQTIPKQNRWETKEGIGAVTEDNYIEILISGEEKFQAVFKNIQNAKREIFIQYYIFKEDFLFQELRKLLCKKASEGVKVRILYDGLGSRKIPGRSWKEMKRTGVEVKCFCQGIGKNIFALALGFNYRNHRKIIVIDNHIGYFGGYNVGKEYLGMEPKFGFWRDTHFRLVGSAVNSLRNVFLQDWGTEEEMENCEGGFGGCAMQMVVSGPTSHSPHIRNVYLRCISSAKRQIWIQTPYFIPDAAVLNALKLALLSGKEVRIMIPCKPDHMFVYWVSMYYAAQLLQMGAGIYIYQKGFLHAKGIIMDEEVYCYGTANMDNRSFYLNYEINAIIYDREEVNKMRTIYEKDCEECKQLTIQEYDSRSLEIRIKEQIFRLLSPLL